jgi:hypothetical protein
MLLKFRVADLAQGPLAQGIGIMLAGFGELDDAFGGLGDDRIIIARKFQRSARHLERNLDYAREIGRKIAVFQYWRDMHCALLDFRRERDSLSATGAWAQRRCR